MGEEKFDFSKIHQLSSRANKGAVLQFLQELCESPFGVSGFDVTLRIFCMALTRC